MGNATHIVLRPSTEFRALSLGLQHVLLTLKEEIEEGDQVVVRELQRDHGFEHTGLWLCRRVTHRLSFRHCPALAEGWIALSLNTPAENEWSTTAIKRQLELVTRAGVLEEVFWQGFEQREKNRARLERRAAGER